MSSGKIVSSIGLSLLFSAVVALLASCAAQVTEFEEETSTIAEWREVAHAVPDSPVATATIIEEPPLLCPRSTFAPLPAESCDHKAFGAACNDGNPRTVGNRCFLQGCSAGEKVKVVPCNTDADCCNLGFCNNGQPMLALPRCDTEKPTGERFCFALTLDGHCRTDAEVEKKRQDGLR